MNVFNSCLPNTTKTRIYLPVEDEEDDYETSNNKSHRNCFTCCLWRSQRKEGLIRLPEGATARRTIDDYLDPRSPVSIEVLLAEQEEELDHYMGQQTDDEDTFNANRRKSAISYSLMDEEDAQFLSEHRISAILVDRPKLSGAHIFHQDTGIVNTVTNDDEDRQPQELMDVAVPVPSTSTSTISSRVFAIKVQPKEDNLTEERENENIVEEDQNVPYESMTKRPISDVVNISSSPKELKSLGHYRVPSISSSASSTHSTSFTANNKFVQPSHAIGSSNSLSVFPTSTTSTNLNSNNTRTSDFPVTTLTRTPYQPPPPMQHDIIPSTSIHTTSSAAILNNTNNTSNSKTVDSAISSQPHPVTGRRPSVVAAAQSLLGDKLDDFTEKLAFIKKNIIMSLDSDDEEELSQSHNHYYNTETLNNKNKNKNRKSLEVNTISGAGRVPPQQYHSGSMEKTNATWDNFILPKFKKQSGSTPSSFQQKRHQQQQQIKPPPRSTSIDHYQHAMPLSVTQENNNENTNNRFNKRRISNASSASSTSNGFNSEDDEEIFDFSKVVAMSKNVRTFSEGVMGNGLRMFNNLSTRIKNANQNEHHLDTK